MSTPVRFVLCKRPIANRSLKEIKCWVVKFLADTPPCPGGVDHGKPEAG